jgi:hypothetical protein
MLWIDLVGYAASSVVLATFCMKTMRPLRILALASNVLFVVYGFFGGIYPVLILHVVLFPSICSPRVITASAGPAIGSLTRDPYRSAPDNP